VKIQFIGKRWTGNALYSQAAVNKVLSDTWPKIQSYVDALTADRINFPMFRNRLIPLRRLMRQARSVAYLNHAQFFIIYGQIAAILTGITEEHHRRTVGQLKAKRRQAVDSLDIVESVNV
jgi:hypothetical protein